MRDNQRRARGSFSRSDVLTGIIGGAPGRGVATNWGPNGGSCATGWIDVLRDTPRRFGGVCAARRRWRLHERSWPRMRRQAARAAVGVSEASGVELRIPAVCRDPDSNRGHHDFQCASLPLKFLGFAGDLPRIEGFPSAPGFPAFCARLRSLRPTRRLVGLFLATTSGTGRSGSYEPPMLLRGAVALRAGDRNHPAINGRASAAAPARTRARVRPPRRSARRPAESRATARAPARRRCAG
jgi:hypothetical protein